MGKEIRFEVPDDQFEQLKAVKDRRGYTWKGLMLEGVKAIDIGDGDEYGRQPAPVVVDGQGGRRDSAAP